MFLIKIYKKSDISPNIYIFNEKLVIFKPLVEINLMVAFIYIQYN